MGKAGVLGRCVCVVSVLAIAAGFAATDAPLRRSTVLSSTRGRHEPREAARLYNDACLKGRSGEVEDAAKLLIAAVRSGFDDFSHMRRDPDMRPLHSHPIYQAILAARDAAEPMLAERRLDAWRSQHGSSQGRGRKALQEHRWIAEAVVAGNADLASLLMAQHIRASRDNLLSVMASSTRRTGIKAGAGQS